MVKLLSLMPCIAAANSGGFFAEYIAGWETAAVICFIVGIVLMVIEMLTPGLGIAGVGGACALIAAVVLRADSWTNALITLAIIVILLLIAGIIIFHSFNRGLISRSSIMLNDAITGGSTSLSDDEAKSMVGLTGTAVNDLRPTGYAEFSGKRIDVCAAQGEFIARGSYVKIVGIDGIRINVVKVDSPSDEESGGTDDAAL